MPEKLSRILRSCRLLVLFLQYDLIDLFHTDENNDDDERLARRKSRLLEPHPASANSPCANTSTAKRREAAAPRGISQAQIGEHYGNCIRLAAENKITAKNAFNLHLIDYMSVMLKNEDYASFQVCLSVWNNSCTSSTISNRRKCNS